MKQPFNTRWLLAAVLVIAGALTCQAQLRMGVKGGAVVNDLRFNRDVLDADNRMGFVGGIVADLSLPITGFGVEASVLYTHRDNRLSDGYETFKRDYVDIPVHLRFKLGVVGLGRIISPYVFTGPNFSILFHEDLPTGYESSKTYMSWDFWRWRGAVPAPARGSQLWHRLQQGDALGWTGLREDRGAGQGPLLDHHRGLSVLNKNFKSL